MKYRLSIFGLLAVALSAGSAQVASHAPTAIASTASAQTSPLQVSDKPVAQAAHGRSVPVPPNHDATNESPEWCIYYGEPRERK